MVVQKHDVEDFLNFFKFPYALLREELFKQLSLLAKVLYSIALDKSNLSLRNRWIDEHGVYIIYKVETMMEDTGYSNKTIVKAKQDLIDVGLIETKKQFNGADLIYVNKISDVLNKSVESTLTEVKKIHNESVESTLTEVKNLHSSQTNYSQTNLTRLIEPDDDRASTLYSNSTIGRALKENGVRVNHRHHQELLEYVGRENMSFDMIVRAIEITGDSQEPSFKYLRGILENWRKQGFTSLEQVEEHERQRQKPKEKQEYDPVGNIPEWSNLHPENADEPKKESVYNPERWKKWLEEKKNGK